MSEGNIMTEVSHSFPGVVTLTNVTKKFRKFKLDIPQLSIPKGFATALIGENGAGKTTLMHILAGIRLDYKGELRYFGKWSDKDREDPRSGVREAVGYTGPGNYYLPHWTVRQVKEVSGLLFDGFHPDKFDTLVRELAIVSEEGAGKSKKVSELSDGNRMKLMLAGVLARDTSLLVLDEPASPLDPLMRDKLCEMLRAYLEEGEGEKTVFFSTHNIADMENVTDYAVIMEHGRVVEQGFVEDLKEKYILVKGEGGDVQKAKEILYSITASRYGFEGICLAKDLDRLAGMDVSRETPSLSQISVAVMKAYTGMKLA